MLRSEVLVSSVIMNGNVFCDVTMYSMTDHYQHSGGPCCCFRFQGRRVASTLKMEAARSSKMLACLLHIITRKSITFIVSCCENRKSHAIRTTLKNCLYWCTINSTWYISLPQQKIILTLCWVIWKYKYAVVHSYKTKDCLTPAFLCLTFFCILRGGR